MNPVPVTRAPRFDAVNSAPPIVAAVATQESQSGMTRQPAGRA
jgi:hypothetical protein